MRNLRVLMVQDFSDMLDDPYDAPCCCKIYSSVIRDILSRIAACSVVTCSR